MEELTWRAAYDLWLGTKAENTRRGYTRDLQHLAEWLSEPGPLAALKMLAGNGSGRAYELTIGFQQWLKQQGYAVATRNRRLATIKSAVKFLNALDVISYRVPVKAERLSRDLHDQLIPLDKVAAMMELAGPRMRAALWLLYCPALRVGEVEGLDVDDLDLERGLIWFIGKQRTERESHDLPEQAIAALREWLKVRERWVAELENPPDALFISSHRKHRLGSRSIYRIVHDLGRKVGLTGVGCHSLRHTGITQAARERGDYGAVQEFRLSEHLRASGGGAAARNRERRGRSAGDAPVNQTRKSPENTAGRAVRLTGCWPLRSLFTACGALLIGLPTKRDGLL